MKPLRRNGLRDSKGIDGVETDGFRKRWEVERVILETDIESRLVRGVEKRGGICLKVGFDGWPDRLCLLPGGRVVWVETKRPGGTASGAQRWRVARLRRMGFRAEIPYTADAVDEILESLDK